MEQEEKDETLDCFNIDDMYAACMSEWMRQQYRQFGPERTGPDAGGRKDK